MAPRRWVLTALVVGTVAAGCGGAPSVPTAANKLVATEPAGAGAGPRQKPHTPAVMPRAPEPGPPLPPLAYEAKGRRDPFRPLSLATEKSGLDVSTVRLVGIIQGRQVLALIEAADGLGYILKPGDVLGNGRVTSVTPNSVTFAVAGRAGQRESSLTLGLTKE